MCPNWLKPTSPLFLACWPTLSVGFDRPLHLAYQVLIFFLSISLVRNLLVPLCGRTGGGRVRACWFYMPSLSTPFRSATIINWQWFGRASITSRSPSWSFNSSPYCTEFNFKQLTFHQAVDGIYSSHFIYIRTSSLLGSRRRCVLNFNFNTEQYPRGVLYENSNIQHACCMSFTYFICLFIYGCQRP